MEAHKCDRCGKYVDTNDIPQIRGWASEMVRTIGTPRISMELCPECFDALKEFLKGDEGDKEETPLELLEETYVDFLNCESGEGWLKIDGKEYSTDTGYALEGMGIFMEVFERRLVESEG